LLLQLCIVGIQNRTIQNHLITITLNFKRGEKVENTEWHKVTAWGKIAEIIEKYVVKGKEIVVEGKLTHRSYEDKDGTKRYVTEVVANDILLLGK
jgi:single-strand DNA-binding protein